MASEDKGLIEKGERAGFAHWTLKNEYIKLSIYPQLGAKIWSLYDRTCDYEWLWEAKDEGEPFANAPDDDFSRSMLAGVDECFPTVAACSVKNVSAPDHGAVWSRPWALDESQIEKGILKTDIEHDGFALSREIRLQGKQVVVDYTVSNQAPLARPFLWSWHPLLKAEAGSRLQFEPQLANVRIDYASEALSLAQGDLVVWPDLERDCDLSHLNFLEGEKLCCKCFSPHPFAGVASLLNEEKKAQISFQASSAEPLYLGIWANKKGWGDYEHVALEPTTAPYDSLAEASRDPSNFIGPSETKKWSVSVKLEVLA